MAEVDPKILAIFGPPPEGLDLDLEITTKYNIIVIIFFALAVFAVALRFYVRKYKAGNIWYDDWAILLAVLCTSSTVAMTVIAGNHGAGEHIWKTNIPRFITLLKVVYAEPFIYALAVTSVKISVLLLYCRLFYTRADSTSAFTVMLKIATFLTGVYPFVLWITMAFACRPVSYYWTQYLGAEGTCIDVKLFFLLLGIVNMFNDIVLLFFPIPRIILLQMKMKMKASVAGIMLLGGLVCIASIIRIYYLNGLFQNVDASWWMGPGFGWSSIEPSVAIISACLPTLAPLFRMGRSQNSSSATPYGYSSKPLDNSKAGGSRGGRFALSSSNRNDAAHFGADDDEMELTHKIEGSDESENHTSGTQESSDCGQGITVKTHVEVTTCDRQGDLRPDSRRQELV